MLTALKAQMEEILAAIRQQEGAIIDSFKEALPKEMQNFPVKTYAEAAKKMEDNVTKMQSAMNSSMAISEAVEEIKQSSEDQ